MSGIRPRKMMIALGFKELLEEIEADISTFNALEWLDSLGYTLFIHIED